MNTWWICAMCVSDESDAKRWQSFGLNFNVWRVTMGSVEYVQHVPCLVMYRCWALRRSTKMKKIKQDRADGLGAVKVERGGLNRGTEDRRKDYEPLTLRDIDKQVYMRGRRQCWPNQHGDWPKSRQRVSTCWLGDGGRAGHASRLWRRRSGYATLTGLAV